MNRPWKLLVAVVAIAAALLLFPYVRDAVDFLGADEDGTDSTVSSIVEWLLTIALAMLLYSAAVSVPRLLETWRSRAKPR